MQGFGQPPEDPFGEPLNGALEPFISDPFDAMLNALEQNMTSGAYPVEKGPSVRPGDKMDDLLTRLEDSIENSSSIPLELEMTDMRTESCDSTDDRFSLPQAGSRDVPPLPYHTEESQQATPPCKPHRPAGRIGRRGGRGFTNSHTGPGDKIYCPIKKDYVVFPDFCENQDCEYYDEGSDQENSWSCTYYKEENF